MERRAIKIGRYTVELTHEDKLLFPKPRAITKQAFIEYYERIAPVMLPYMHNRPLTMHRFVQGITHEGFYQKDAGSYFPAWVKTKAISKEAGGMTRYVVCNNAATLVYLANQLCITPHLWLSRIDKLNYPDRMIFDLDPSGKDFGVVRTLAKQLRQVLEDAGLKPFVMTTGSRGLHVVTPLKRVHTFDQVRAWAYTVAQHVVNENPQCCTLEVRKDKRRGKVFIDVLRNSYGATAVAPYAVRAHPGAPVATPLDWDELPLVRSAQKYTIKTIFKRLSTQTDPWQGMDNYAAIVKKIQILS